jgi:O-antigen ligase
MNATAWWALAWLALAVFSTLISPFRARGLAALHKLLPWLQIPVALALVRSSSRLRSVVLAWIAGTTVLALLTIAQAAGTMVKAHASGLPLLTEGSFARVMAHKQLAGQDALAAIIVGGDMHDGQRLAAACLASLALLLFDAGLRGRPGAAVLALALPLQTTALLLTFKRGACLAALAMAAALMLLRVVARRAGPRRLLAGTLSLLPIAAMGALLLACAVVIPLSPALTRRTAPGARAGGRVCMWTRIAPALVRQHPWFGRGFKTLRHEDLAAIARRVEARQTHVHANSLQVLIDTGLVGALVFLGWMTAASRRAWRAAVNAAAPQIAIAAMLTALMLCGFVEYQFGSAQMVLLYGMLMGCLGVPAGERPEKGQRPA